MFQALLAILVLSVAACGDNAPACDTVTRYMSAEIVCFDGEGDDLAICVPNDEMDGLPTCRRRCAPTPGPVCLEGEWPTTIVALSAESGVYEAPICYCEPQPTRHVAIVRDHR